MLHSLYHPWLGIKNKIKNIKETVGGSAPKNSLKGQKNSVSPMYGRHKPPHYFLLIFLYRKWSTDFFDI